MSNKIVGIDLGTTFSAIAVLDSIGNPEILPDLKNNRITPSAVYLSPNNESKVGSEALSAVKAEPNRVITEIKRHMRDEVVYSIKEGKWIERSFSDKNEVTEVLLFKGRLNLFNHLFEPSNLTRK